MRRAVMAAMVAAGVMFGVAVIASADPHPNNGPTRVVGTAGDDVLSGNHGPDILIGKAGDDRLWGGKGPDTFRCGPGHDVVHNRKDTGADVIAASCEEVKG